MELFLICICAFIGVVIVSATIIGITLYDIRSIKLDKDFRLHPYAKRFRQRPLVSIIINGEPTDECLKSIRRSNYRKIEIVKDAQIIKGTFMLSLSGDTVIERTAISSAIRRLNSDPTMHRFELLPSIQAPQTLRQFFQLYHHLATAPYTYSRAGLNMYPHQTSWPVLVNTQTQTNPRRSYAYEVVRWLGNSANLLILMYLAYIALLLMQPEFLLGYLLGFSLWLLWSICGNRQLSLIQKKGYILLAPAPLGYFVMRTLLAPFWPKQYSFFLRAFQTSH